MKVIQENDKFPIAEFNDFYGNNCYVKLSSMFYPRCIWIGKDGSPMHLSVEQVEELLPILTRFVKTGDIIENG